MTFPEQLRNIEKDLKDLRVLVRLMVDAITQQRYLIIKLEDMLRGYQEKEQAEKAQEEARKEAQASQDGQDH